MHIPAPNVILVTTVSAIDGVGCLKEVIDRQKVVLED
jgi:hypothetical protein